MSKDNIVDIIDVEQRHYQTIKEILSSFLPYKKVLAYGSRVKWNANETSDLDLAVFNATNKQIYNAKEAFDESNIPFIVQILNWETIPQDFKENIEQKYHILQKEDDWGIFKLGEVVEIGSSKRIFYNEYTKKGIPFYRSKEIIEKNKGNEISTELFISHKRFKEIEQKYGSPIKGDILLTSVGTLGVPYLVEGEEFYFKDGNLTWFKNFKDLLVNKFLYYWITSSVGYDKLRNSSIGSTQPALTIQGLKNLEIHLPPLAEQKAIAEILSSLDDRIDLLHRQNKTLENLAETLFRHYFIDNAKDDWDSEEIGKYVTVVDNRGKTPPNQKETTPYPVIEVNALGKGDRLVDYSLIRKYVDKNTFENWFRTKPKKYDILVSTVGSIGEFSMFILEVGNIAQNVIALQAKEISPFYLYQILKYKHEEVMNLDIGGVQPSIKVPHLLSIIIPIPEIEIQKEFDTQITEFVKKMETNYLQIQTLEKLRDTLLPKLISGEIRVNYKENE